MSDTKEKILHTALRLFARDGYEAVPVSAIAGELGLTKGAVYKHYRSKRDIFDSIAARIYQMDEEQAKKYKVPEKTFDKSPEAYRNTAAAGIKAFTAAQFRFWIEDEFARNCRTMLILEQYRNPDMADLFREMMKRGVWNKDNPKQLALEFYAPFYLLLSISDVSRKEEALRLLTAYTKRFIERNIRSS
jgi:AcrR family transcriptional regulator